MAGAPPLDYGDQQAVKYWTFQGKKYYSYASYAAAVAAYQKVLAAAAAAKAAAQKAAQTAAARTTTAQKAVYAVEPSGYRPPVRNTSQYAAAIAAARAEAERRRIALLRAQQAAAAARIRARLAAQARARLQALTQAASQRQTQIVGANTEAQRTKARENMVAAVRARAYKRLQDQTNQAREFTQRLLGEEAGILRNPPKGKPQRQVDFAAALKHKQQVQKDLIDRARQSGDWKEVLDKLDQQSKTSNGRWHDEALYQALQKEVVAPMNKVYEDFVRVIDEYAAAEAAGDTARMIELATDNTELREQFLKLFGDGRKPGVAQPIMATLTEMARRRDRVWLATVTGQRPDQISDQQYENIENTHYWKTIYDASGRPKRVHLFGVEAYLAREQARTMELQRQQYRSADRVRRGLRLKGYEPMVGPNGQTQWRRQEVGEALRMAATNLGVSDEVFAQRLADIQDEPSPIVQEVEMKRLLTDIADNFVSDYRQRFGDLNDQTIRGAADYTRATTESRKAQDRALRQYMEKVIYGLTGQRGGGEIDYRGRYLPAIAHLLPALSDPVNDIVNNWTNFTRPGTAMEANFFDLDKNGLEGLYNQKIVSAKDDPEIAREYELWLANRDSPDGDVRSAANRRWREVVLTGNVSFIADVGLDPLNVLGLATKPFQALNLARKAGGGFGAVAGRTGRYMIPQWMNAADQADFVAKMGIRGMPIGPKAPFQSLNYYHVRADRARIAAAHELGLTTQQALNKSDADWEELFRVSRMGEEAIGQTTLGAQLLNTPGVNRTQILNVIQDRLPALLARHGVVAQNPFEYARNMERVAKNADEAAAAKQIADELADNLAMNPKRLEALRNVRLSRGDIKGAQRLANARSAVKLATRQLESIEYRLSKIAEQNAGRGAEVRRATGVSDELNSLLEGVELEIQRLKGGNPAKTRKIQDRIAVLQATIRRRKKAGLTTEAYDKKLAAARAELKKVPGIDDRRAYHQAIEARERILADIELARKQQGIYSHFNTPARIKQVTGQLRKAVNARVKSAWGMTTKSPLFGRGLYLSGDDAVWGNLDTLDTLSIADRKIGGAGKSKGGGVMPSNKRKPPAAEQQQIRRSGSKLSRAFYQLNTGARIREIASITDLRAAFREMNVPFTGSVNDLPKLADALREAGWEGVSLVGIRKWRGTTAAQMKKTILGDQLVIFDPQRSGAWIDETLRPGVDDSALQSAKRAYTEELEKANLELRRATQDYAPNRVPKHHPVKIEEVSPTAKQVGSQIPARSGKRTQEIERVITVRDPDTGELVKQKIKFTLEVEQNYASILDDLTNVTTEFKALADEAAELAKFVSESASVLTKLPGRKGVMAVREANIKLKELLQKMERFEDQHVLDENGMPKVEPGLISKRLNAVSDYHNSIHGDPTAPSYVDTTWEWIRRDREYINAQIKYVGKQIHFAKSEAQARVFIRQLETLKNAKKGLEIEARALDSNRGAARVFGVSNLDRVKGAVRPQRLAHLARDEQARLFGVADDINRRLRRTAEIEEPADIPQSVQDFAVKYYAQLEKIPANRVPIVGRTGATRTIGLVRRLEQEVGRQLSLIDAWVILEHAMQSPVHRAMYSRLRFMVRKRVHEAALERGFVGKEDQLFKALTNQHHYSNVPPMTYAEYKELDALFQERIQNLREWQAEGQVRLQEVGASGKNRDFTVRDSDPRVTALKLQIAREKGLSMFAYDEVRTVFSDLMLRENRAKELAEQAEKLAAANGTEWSDEFLKLRELRGEEEAIRNFEEFAARPENRGLPLERVIRLFQEKYILNDLGQNAALPISRYKHTALSNAWKEITGFEHADEARRAEFLQGNTGRWGDDPPPLHRRDLMREWFVRNGRWDPETGDAIRLGRRVWSVPEERALYMDEFGFEPVWVNEDWLRPILRDQRAYQRAYRSIGFVDNEFEALADGANLTGKKLRGSSLQNALVWGKEGFTAQRTLDEMRHWAASRYGHLVVDKKGNFISMPWLMKLNDPWVEYLPWLRHALSLEGRDEFREALERAKPKMDDYLKSQYFDDVGDLRPLGLDIDPSLLGAQGVDAFREQMNGLREALFNATERRIARMMKQDAFTTGEWMSQEVMLFGYDVAKQLMVQQSWRGLFRGRRWWNQLLHMAGWQRLLVSFNPAFPVMNLAESYGYKRALLSMAENGWAPIGFAGQRWAHRIKTLEDIGDTEVSRVFGTEGRFFGARAFDGNFTPLERFKGGVEDVANYGVRASAFGETQLRLDFARVTYGKAYESLLSSGMTDAAADGLAKAYARSMNRAFFATIGDNQFVQALNQVVPFMSYRYKQLTLAIRMSVEHPWIPLTLGKIQDEIIAANRDAWIEHHGSEVGFDPNDPRAHSLWLWGEDQKEPYRIDLWDVSDWTRATRLAIQTGTLGVSVSDALREFVRVPHPLQLGVWANLTGGVTPWGKPGDWRETFWFVDLAQWMLGNDYENPKWKRDALQMGSQIFFFKGFGKLTEGDMMTMTYFAMKDSGDDKAAQAYLDAHPELEAHWDMMRPYMKPHWDPAKGRSLNFYAQLSDEGRKEYDETYAEWQKLNQALDADVFKYSSRPWSDEYKAAKKNRDLQTTFFLQQNPLLVRSWGMYMTPGEFLKLRDGWLVDQQVDTWFDLLDQRPKRDQFDSDLAYAQAQVKFNEQKALWLSAHPAVSERLYESNNALVQAWHDQELQWTEVMDFQSRLNLRLLQEEAKGAAADPDLIDALYQIKGDTSALLDAEAYAPLQEKLIPGSDKRANAYRQFTNVFDSIRGQKPLQSYIQIPGFADYRYGNASPEEQRVMREDEKYYDQLATLAQSGDPKNWWNNLQKHGLLDRYLRENPDKRDDFAYVQAIGNIVTNYGRNFWSGMMLPDNRWVLNEYLRRHPEKRATYEYMRGLDGIWMRIGNDYSRFYSELAKNPWLEAEYYRRNPEKAGRGATSAYAQAIGSLVNSVSSGKEFYDKLAQNPWLEAEYYRRHPEKRAENEANKSYMAALEPWVTALKRNDFVAAQKAWDAMPGWAQERYLNKHPSSGGMVEGQAYYAALGGWIKLLDKKDFIAADKYFDALPVWMKEKYWAKHPDQRAKMELDSKMLRAAAEYFIADKEFKGDIMAKNPELMRWLQKHGGDEAAHRGLINAIYRAIPSREPWLKRMFRERFPEVFGQAEAGERRLKKVALTLAENPDMLPFYEKAVKLQYQLYSEQFKRQGEVPDPWSMERLSRLKKRRKRRVAISSHFAKHVEISTIQSTR